MLNRVASHSRLAVESPIFIRVGNMQKCMIPSVNYVCVSGGNRQFDSTIRLQREPSNHATRTCRLAHIVCVSEAETRVALEEH